MAVKAKKDAREGLPPSCHANRLFNLSGDEVTMLISPFLHVQILPAQNVLLCNYSTSE